MSSDTGISGLYQGLIYLAPARTTADGRTDLVALSASTNDQLVETLCNGRTQQVSFSSLAIPGPTAQHNVVASYAGDSAYAASVSPALGACGGGSSSSTSTGSGGTPLGTSSVSVSATTSTTVGGSTTQSALLTITIIQ